MARRQHGPFTREQLFQRGLTTEAITHRLRRGRLFVIHRGVYALVPVHELSRKGQWMAALLACGSEALLSDESAACLWGIHHRESRGIEISVPRSVTRAPKGITVHKRMLTRNEATRRDGIPVTNITATLVALAARLPRDELERAITEADRLHLIDPERLRAQLERYAHRPGVAALRATLERHTFTLTDSELERRFLPIARKAGLPEPLTRHHLNGYRVDFFFPTLGLVVETDGQRYHRTAIQQTADRRRDQAHTAAGLTQLRFTHWQIRHDQTHVQTTLARVAKRLSLTLLPPPKCRRS